MSKGNPILGIRLPPDVLERLERLAKLLGKDKSELARDAIVQLVGQK